MTPLEEWLMTRTRELDCPPHLHHIYGTLFAKVSIYDVVLRVLLLPWQMLSSVVSVAITRARADPDPDPASATPIAERRGNL